MARKAKVSLMKTFLKFRGAAQARITIKLLERRQVECARHGGHRQSSSAGKHRTARRRRAGRLQRSRAYEQGKHRGAVCGIFFCKLALG
jgi:hypothetical protein